jgi:hypothetical protein
MLRALVLALAVAFVAIAPGAHALTPQEIRAAAEQTAKDPNLGGKHKEKVLRLRPGDEDKPQKQDSGDALRWLADFIAWLSEAGRTLVWLGGAVLVALLIVGLRRWMAVRGQAPDESGEAPPTHVQGLDIRVASLPAAIGAASARLWQENQHRAALSLLYRGALSRLVHRHSVPVRGSSTEGECVQLARRSLDAERSAFFARLVDVWELAVYGARLPASEAVAELCAAFDALWPPAEGAAA